MSGARIHLLSDLHLEHWDYLPAPVDADVVVLAGDIWTRSKGNPARDVTWAAAHFPDLPVLLVPGNHTYYKGSFPHTLDRLRQAAAATPNVRILDRDEMVVGGVRFLGCTLWTDMALRGDPRAGAAAAGGKEHGMNDYRRIRHSAESFRRLLPGDTMGFHAMDRAWLAARIAEPFSGPTVVVTHHAPSARSIAPEMRGDPLSVAYASNLDEWLETLPPLLWMHGHTHTCVDYRIGAVRVLSNARGYADEPVFSFDPTFTVTV